MQTQSTKANEDNIIRPERVIGSYTAGRVMGRNIATLPIDNFRHYAHGVTQHMDDNQLKHFIEVAFSEYQLRENMKKYNKKGG